MIELNRLVQNEFLFLYLLGGIIVLFVVLPLYIIRKQRSINYNNASPAELIKWFNKEIEEYVKQLTWPYTCDEAARALNKIRPHYIRLLKQANRFPESSREHDIIFSQGLKPVLDKISLATTSKKCFKNPFYKKTFDRFIRATQKHASKSG